MARTKPATKVFLSYARSDRKLVQEVAERIRSAGFHVWDPEIEVLPGGDFPTELKSALESSDAMVVMVSPNSMDARDVTHEIEYAIGAPHMKRRLVPVILKPTAKMPWILETMPMVPFRDPEQTGEKVVEILSNLPYAQQEVSSR